MCPVYIYVSTSLLVTRTGRSSIDAGSFELYFDGSDVSLGSSSDEDIYALADDTTGEIYLSTRGEFLGVGPVRRRRDVFVFTPSSLGSSTSGRFAGTLFFNGSAYGVSGDVYGIDLP